MKTTFDFFIDSDTLVEEVVLIHAQNEEAYTYLSEELDMTIFENGSAPLHKERVGDFISDAGTAHFACHYK